MKILSSYTHPHVVPYLYKFLAYVEHKIRYFEEFWRTKHLLVWNTMEVNGDHQLFDSILQNILFCVQHKKEAFTGLERREGM